MLDSGCANACALNGLRGPMRHWFTGFTHFFWLVAAWGSARAERPSVCLGRKLYKHADFTITVSVPRN